MITKDQLIQRLKELGVPNYKILKVKHEHLLNYKYYRCNKYKSKIIKDSEIELVKPSKIKLIQRASPNYGLLDVAVDPKIEFDWMRLDKMRMEEALTHIMKDTLEEIYDWYREKCNPILLVYYKKEKFYEVGSDGNHRALYSKVVCAPYIRARVKAVYTRKKLYTNII